MGEPHLFRSLDDKVTSGVERALGHVCQLRMRLVLEDTLVTSKHDGKSTDGLSSTLDDLLASRVLDVDENLGGVRRVSQATLVRRDLSVDGFGVRAFWLTDPDVRVLQPEARIDVRRDLGVGLEDLLQLDVDELGKGKRRLESASARQKGGSNLYRKRTTSRKKIFKSVRC